MFSVLVFLLIIWPPTCRVCGDLSGNAGQDHGDRFSGDNTTQNIPLSPMTKFLNRRNYISKHVEKVRRSLRYQKSQKLNHRIVPNTGQDIESSQPAGVEVDKAAIPKFMLDLFDVFDRDHSLQPTSNIIRSFSNSVNLSDREEFAAANDGCSRYPNTNSCRRKYIMVFNVSAIPSNEVITRAELRFRQIPSLYSTSLFRGIEIVVKVEQITCSHRRCPAEKFDKSCSKNCNEREGWLTFDMTKLMLQKRSSQQYAHKIEVELFIVDRLSGLVKIDITSSTTKEPLLVVFSDDTSKHGIFENRMETLELMSRQFDAMKSSRLETEQTAYNLSEVKERRKRSTGRKNSLDIDMDGIKVAVKQRSRSKVKHANSGREKRSIIGGRCRRERMEVTFSEIGYHRFQRPMKYQAYKCVGKCSFPILGATTKHATIHSVMHLHFPKSEEPPCCVPTKLGPISVLYYNDQNVIEYKYEYDEMQVLECGCW